MNLRPFVPAAALALAACTPQTPPRPPPPGEFYYPTSLAQVPSSDGPDGILYVASFNLDKRYDQGTVLAIKLSLVAQDAGVLGLPALGTYAGSTELLISNLNVADAGRVTIQSFAGEMGVFPKPGGVRLFVPSRAEGDYLQVIDAADDALACLGGGDDRNCANSAASLTALNPPGDAGTQNPKSKPRAPQPFGVGVSADGGVFVTHIAPADDPINSGTNEDTYLVQLDARNPANPVSQPDFVSLSIGGLYSGPAASIAVGARYAYISGRFVSPTATLLRLYDTWTPQVLGAGIESTFAALESRGVALNEDETLLYMVTRSPDALLVFSIENPTADPGVRIQEIQEIPLPQGPNELRVISRKALGLGDLVVATCTIANAIVIYDQGLGRLVKDFAAVGYQPFDIAVDDRGSQARFYVSAFSESRILVFDMPDLTQPELTRLVARLGTPDTCFVMPNDPSCPTLPSGGFVP